MPSTCSPRLTTSAFPSITVNSLRYVLYAADNPAAEVASRLYPAPHPQRAVNFPGVDVQNYIFKLYENTETGEPIDGSEPGDAANDLFALFDDYNFNPDSNEVVTRTFEIVTDGVTPGFVDGATVAVLDGTGGKADWRGFNIVVLPPGTGPLLPGYNYTWDEATGTFTLIDGSTFIGPSGALPGLSRMIQFEPKTAAAPGVPGGRAFTTVKVITTDDTLVAGDVGKKIIFNPAVPLIRVKMPTRALVTANRLFLFKTLPQTGSPFCVELYTDDGSEWYFGNAPRTSMYMMPNESFEAYNEITTGIEGWHTQNEVGNFSEVGDTVFSDKNSMINGVLLDRTLTNVNQHARLYNEFILNLDPSQVCAFADAATNPTKFSYRGTGADADNFYIADRRNLTAKATNLNTEAGTKQDQQLLKHRHIQDTSALDGINGGSYGHTDATFSVGTYGGPVVGTRGLTSRAQGITATDGTNIDGDENRVNSYLINQFVKV